MHAAFSGTDGQYYQPQDHTTYSLHVCLPQPWGNSGVGSDEIEICGWLHSEDALPSPFHPWGTSSCGCTVAFFLTSTTAAQDRGRSAPCTVHYDPFQPLSSSPSVGNCPSSFHAAPTYSTIPYTYLPMDLDGEYRCLQGSIETRIFPPGTVDARVGWQSWL